MQTTTFGASACPTCGTVYDYGVAVCPKDGTLMSGWKPPITGEHDPVLGQKLGDYEVQKRVAHGGMGIVYLAVHPVMGRQAAVKVLRPEMASNPQQVERFLSEARAISAIRHRGIVDVFNFGQLPDGRQFMLMEYLEGEALDVIIARDAPLPYSMALPMLDEILDALSAAHGAGVIHRDLKPSNVLIARQSNGTKVVKLVDFGLAKQTPLGDPNAQAFARASLIAGTPEYISPEQIRGEAATAQTDLYGFGVVAFEMLTRKLPFVGQTVVDTLEMHARRAPPHVKVFRGDVPAALDDLVFRMMSKRPDERPNSAEAARQELQRMMREMNIDVSMQPRDAPTSPSLPGIPAVSDPGAGEGKGRRALLLGLGGLLLVGVAGAAFLMGRGPSPGASEGPLIQEIPLGELPANPGPVPPPTPTATADPAQPNTAVAAVDPGDKVEPAELLPAGNKGKPGKSAAAPKRRPFQEYDGLSDAEWRAKMVKRLDADWTRVVAKSAREGKPAPNRIFFDKAQRAVEAAKGRAQRLEANREVARWESNFLK